MIQDESPAISSGYERMRERKRVSYHLNNNGKSRNDSVNVPKSAKKLLGSNFHLNDSDDPVINQMLDDPNLPKVQAFANAEMIANLREPVMIDLLREDLLNFSQGRLVELFETLA